MFTLDTELIWGSFHQYSSDEFERLYPDIRGTIRDLLGLLDRYQLPATWAVVGHLFLEGCDRSPDGPHPEVVRPHQKWRPGDWYAADPCTDRMRDPLWYGDDILDMIQGARTPHEIGSHSFSHILYGDPELSEEAAESDLRACLDVAARRGISLRSFVFPFNSEGHHDVLRRNGFRAYRGLDPSPYQRMPYAVNRGGHLVEHAVGVGPPVSRPHEMLPGLWNIPGSTFFSHRGGLRRGIPRLSRLRRARAGLRKAREDGAVFHLWTHPFNLADDPRYLLGILDEIFSLAAGMRDRDELRIETMGDAAERLAAGSSPPAGESRNALAENGSPP